MPPGGPHHFPFGRLIFGFVIVFGTGICQMRGCGGFGFGAMRQLLLSISRDRGRKLRGCEASTSSGSVTVSPT